MDIGVVIVTYNRKEYLIKALESYEKQTFKPKYILVVNNNSTDGTYETLNKWEEKIDNIERIVINLKENLGGSGGFHVGLTKCLDLKADWIWIADDDAYPQLEALNSIKNFSLKNDLNNVSALCAAVINEGEYDLLHRKKFVKSFFNIEQVPINKEEYSKEYFQVDLFSYVGAIINKKYLESCGVTEKEYFIYYDDTEHSYRLSQKGKILCIPKVRVIHNVRPEINGVKNWKEFYAIRNKLLFYKKHFQKRYYIFLLAKLKIKNLKEQDKVIKKMVNTAIEDAVNNIQGLNKIYKPGWKNIRK